MNSIFDGAPAHWRAIRLKRTVTGCRNGTWGEEPRGGPGDVVCVRVADFDRRRMRVTPDNATPRFVPEALRRESQLQPGALPPPQYRRGGVPPVGAGLLY